MVMTVGSECRLLAWVQACKAVGSLLEELARREAVAQQQIEEIREQIAALESRLETEQGRLSRLVITRETVEEILGDASQLVHEPARDADAAEVSALVQRAAVGDWGGDSAAVATGHEGGGGVTAGVSGRGRDHD